jgi:hypothetical protein
MHRRILHDAKGLLRCTASLCTVLVVALIFSLFLAEVLGQRAAPVWGRPRSRTTTLYVLESFETVGLEIHGKLATQARSRLAHPMSRNCFGRTHSSPKHAEGPYLTIGFLLTFIFSVSTNGPKYVRSEHWTATPMMDVTQLTNNGTQFDT